MILKKRVRKSTMYSPKINEKYIPELYKLGKKLNKPMTRIVNEAIIQYLEYLKYKLNKPKILPMKPPENATPNELSKYFRNEQKNLEVLLSKGDIFIAINIRVLHINYNSALDELNDYKHWVGKYSKEAVELHKGFNE